VTITSNPRGGSDVLIEGNTVIGTRREGILLHEFEADGGTAVTGNFVRRNLVRDAGTDVTRSASEATATNRLDVLNGDNPRK